MRKGLIGITGRANSGKDLVASIIQGNLMKEFTIYKLAGPLKNACCEFFGWTADQVEDREFKEAIDPKWGFSPRLAMQRLGTEWGRSLREDLWIHMAQVKLESPETKGLIVSDVRFENEAAFIRKNNGLLIHVRRDGHSTKENTHASEAGVEMQGGDAFVDNNGTIEDLRAKVERIVAGHFWAH